MEKENQQKRTKKPKITTQLEQEQKEILQSLSSPPENDLSVDSSAVKQADFIKRKSDKKIRKELVTERMLGIKKDEEISKRQKSFKRFCSIIFIVFVLAVLAFTAYHDFSGGGDRQFPEWEDFKALLIQGWKFLLLAFLSLFLNYLFKCIKFSIMCKSVTGKWHIKTCFEVAIIGNYYNNITPLAMGGQPFEIYHLSKHGVHGGAASSIPIAAFFLNQAAFVIVGVVSISLFTNNTLNIPSALYNAFPETFRIMAIVGAALCTIVPFLVVLFCLLPKLTSKLVHFVMFLGGKMRIVKDPKDTTLKTIKTVYHNATCLKGLAKKPLIFISTLVFSILQYLSSLSIIYFVLRVFNFNIEGFGSVNGWLQICQLGIMLFLAVSFIPTPGNSGAADLSFYVLFAVGLPAGFAFPAMVVWRIISFYSYIIIGFSFATIKKRSDLKKQTQNAMPTQ